MTIKYLIASSSVGRRICQGFFFEHLLEYHKGDGLFVFNKNELKHGLKGVALTSRVGVVNKASAQTLSKRQVLRRDFFQASSKRVTKRSTKSVFGSRFIKHVK